MKTRPLMGVIPSATRQPHSPVIPSAARNLLFLLLFLSQSAFAQLPPDAASELTLSQFRAMIPVHAVEKPQAAASVREIFFKLLAAQGREAAARQSLDRLSGWTKAAQARLDAQSAPLLDVEMLRFAEAKAEARVEQAEAEQHSAAAQANRLLGREPRSPLLALPAERPSSSAPPSVLPEPASGPPDKFAARITRLEQQLLPQAQDLLQKIYQNYLYGGVTLTTLLWQEDQVYQTELQYRLLLAEAERARAAGD